jgi:methionyl-tRNA formyltransferase
LGVSVHFTHRLGRDVLAIPRLGTVNVHGALLPRNRGLFPYFWELANGDADAGVTVHWVDEKLDTGDVILQRAIQIDAGDTVSSLAWKGADTGAALLEDVLALLASGAAPRVRQPAGGASYFSWPKRADVTRLRRAGRGLGSLRDAWRRIMRG